MYTYLIVDDESLIRKGTIKKLSDMNDRICCIGEASEGEEALHLIAENRPDFVILDMQMPGMNGVELLARLSELYPDMPLIVISGYKDFDYVKQAITASAIDYLLKPFSRDAIKDCVQRAIDRLENSQTISRQISDSNEQKEAAYYEYDIQYLTNLVLGYHTGDNSITSKRLTFINDTHHMILLTLCFSKDPAEFRIQDWLEEGGFGDLALYLDGNVPLIRFLVLFLPGSGGNHSEKMASEISAALIAEAAQLGLSLLVGISRQHSDLQELHTAFLESSSALDQQMIGDSAISCFRYTGESTPRSVVWEQEDEFLFRIEAGMETEVRELVSRLFSWFADMPQFTLADAKYYCYKLSYLCMQILLKYMKQQNSATSGSMQSVVSRMFRLEEVKEFYLQFFMNIAGLLKGESIYAIDDVVEKVQLYIRNNYQKDLTQDFLASLFYLNRSYLSTLFRQKTGMKFIDYLNDVRIERSMDMLANSDRKMYQISKAVGYDNPKYFFRIFKKRTGMTPEQYRNHQNDNS